MFRTSLILGVLAAALAAGSAFASSTVVGHAAHENKTTGDIWLDNGMKFTVSQDLASNLLPGKDVSISYVLDGTGNDVVSASPVN